MNPKVALRILQAIIDLKQELEKERDPYIKSTIMKRICFLRQCLRENEDEEGVPDQ